MPPDNDSPLTSRPPAAPELPQRLSPRELSCLHWAAQGKTSVEIGLILGISSHTVNFHILNASRRLGVYGRQAAITAAWRAGLLSTARDGPTRGARRGAAHRRIQGGGPDRLTRLPHSGKIGRP